MIEERIKNVKDAVGASPRGCAVLPGLGGGRQAVAAAQGCLGGVLWPVDLTIAVNEQVGSGAKSIEQQIGVFDGELTPPLNVFGTIVDAAYPHRLMVRAYELRVGT